MQNEQPLTSAERELEAALQGLLPADPAINRDRLMFLAGQATARHRGRVWQGAASVFAAAFAISLAIRPAPRSIDRSVQPREDSPAVSATAVTPVVAGPSAQHASEGGATYLRPRDDVFVLASGAMPSRPTSAATATEPLPRLERLSRPSTQGPRTWDLFGLENLINPGDRL